MKARRFFAANMRAEDMARITGHMCAWKGCTQTTPIEDGLPHGWRWLALWTGPALAKPWGNACRMDRDAVLCPKHAQELHYEHLKDIGQHLDVPRGNA